MRAQNRSVGDPQFLVAADIFAEIGKRHEFLPSAKSTTKMVDAVNS
jgi:hypothetical protein